MYNNSGLMLAAGYVYCVLLRMSMSLNMPTALWGVRTSMLLWPARSSVSLAAELIWGVDLADHTWLFSSYRLLSCNSYGANND